MPNVALSADSTTPAEARRTASYSTPPSLLYFFRALEMAPSQENGFSRPDVKRVEAVWEVGNGDWTSCGYVVALRDGRRAYLEYHFGEHLREDDSGELVEKVEVLPMDAERYPQVSGIGLTWTDDVKYINAHLPA